MRQELESAVISVNAPLKDEVKNMSLVTLLRNCHPIYRADYARLLHQNGQITKDEMEEFTKK